MELYYDLHMHSCLSPCADDDMTPGNIAAMAKLAGLDAVALTDHNTCGNVRVFCARAAEQGIIGIPGMELTTREEIHVVCLFPGCDEAEAFSSHVSDRLPAIQNRSEIFGCQILIGADDEPCGEESRLLINAADIGVYDVVSLMSAYGGFAYPAHIDRDSFSLLTVLGMWDDGLGFTMYELSHCMDSRKPQVKLPFVVSSDAHRLCDIPDAEKMLKIAAPTAQAVIDALKSL